MLLEDIYGIETLNEFQRSSYLRVAEILKPINEVFIDPFKTAILVKFAAGRYVLEITLHPKAPDSFNVVLVLNSTDYVLSLDGFSRKVPMEAVPISVSDDALDPLLATLTRAFRGQVKIVEERAQGRPYRWSRYDFIGGSWQLEASRRLLLFNYFGKKTSVVCYCRLY